jgi:hypothetical protein
LVRSGDCSGYLQKLKSQRGDGAKNMDKLKNLCSQILEPHAATPEPTRQSMDSEEVNPDAVVQRCFFQVLKLLEETVQQTKGPGDS